MSIEKVPFDVVKVSTVFKYFPSLVHIVSFFTHSFLDKSSVHMLISVTPTRPRGDLRWGAAAAAGQGAPQ